MTNDDRALHTQFATAAMQGLVAANEYNKLPTLAGVAFLMADDMLAEYQRRIAEDEAESLARASTPPEVQP